MECDPLTVLPKDTNLYFLTLGLEINVADLWVSHYSDHQQYLFGTITKFRADGWSYNKISQWFNDNNILTPRGKQFVPPSVHSIVKQKRINEQRFGRTFPLVINEADINKYKQNHLPKRWFFSCSNLVCKEIFITEIGKGWNTYPIYADQNLLYQKHQRPFGPWLIFRQWTSTLHLLIFYLPKKK